MKKFLKIIIALVVIVLLIFIFFFFVKGNVFAPSSEKITINKIKNSYSPAEDIVVGGLTKKNTEIILLFDKKVGGTKSNGAGQWVVNLGKKTEGKYSLELYSKDSKKTNSVATSQIIVANTSGEVSFLESVSNFLTAGLSYPASNATAQTIMVPRNAPQVLQGKWSLLK